MDVMRLLFLGNSATYVHDVPQILAGMAREVGVLLEVEQVTRGGYTLAQHADASTEHGGRVLEAIRRGHDVVFLQDNGNCILSDERRAACKDACERLVEEIRASGAKPFFYVRPPYEKPLGDMEALEQCRRFDQLFEEMDRELGGVACVWVNRAFAYAMQHNRISLWGEDHAHVSLQGAHLIAYTFFAKLLGRSASQAGVGRIPENEARMLQMAADAAAFGKKEECL